MNIFIEQIIDMIVHKNLLGHTSLNLMQRIMKSQGRRMMALEKVKLNFATHGLHEEQSKIKFTLTDFLSQDNFNA